MIMCEGVSSAVYLAQSGDDVTLLSMLLHHFFDVGLHPTLCVSVIRSAFVALASVAPSLQRLLPLPRHARSRQFHQPLLVCRMTRATLTESADSLEQRDARGADVELLLARDRPALQLEQDESDQLLLNSINKELIHVKSERLDIEVVTTWADASERCCARRKSCSVNSRDERSASRLLTFTCARGRSSTTDASSAFPVEAD